MSRQNPPKWCWIFFFFHTIPRERDRQVSRGAQSGGHIPRPAGWPNAGTPLVRLRLLDSFCPDFTSEPPPPDGLFFKFTRCLFSCRSFLVTCDFPRITPQPSFPFSPYTGPRRSTFVHLWTWLLIRQLRNRGFFPDTPVDPSSGVPQGPETSSLTVFIVSRHLTLDDPTHSPGLVFSSPRGLLPLFF